MKGGCVQEEEEEEGGKKSLCETGGQKCQVKVRETLEYSVLLRGVLHDVWTEIGGGGGNGMNEREGMVLVK